ncbi:MAG: phosphatase PAP2 family protein [Planctomycetota bacterium]
MAEPDRDRAVGRQCVSRPLARRPLPCIPEQIWACYLVCVGAIAVLAPGGGSPQHDVATFFLVHAGIATAVAFCAACARRSQRAARWPRAALTIAGLPIVFSALCWLLPAVHPEPYELVWRSFDRWLFGADLAVAIGTLPPWLVEVLQIDYAAFYFLCIGSTLLALRSSGVAAFDRAVVLMVGGFLCSYLGYLLVPTIAPKVVLQDLPPLEGLWLTQSLRTWIDGAEMNHWDCFPSGHTMMTTTSLIVLWRWARRSFWWLLLPGLALIASTMLLRYHWCADVLAGATIAWPCVRLCDWLMARGGWPPA